MAKHKLHMGQLLTAVSVIGLSVGMVAAEAADNGSQGVLIGLSKQDKHATQIKGESQYIKIHNSLQSKSDASALNPQPLPPGATTGNNPGNSIQGKVHAGAFNPQPDPPGDASVQIKLHSSQIKMDSSQAKIVSPRDPASGLPTGK